MMAGRLKQVSNREQWNCRPGRAPKARVIGLAHGHSVWAGSMDLRDGDKVCVFFCVVVWMCSAHRLGTGWVLRHSAQAPDLLMHAPHTGHRLWPVRHKETNS